MVTLSPCHPVRTGGRLLAFIIGVLISAIQAGTSVLYAALGEVISERAGVINLGVEGGMLMGAVTGFLVTQETGNAWVGVLAALLIGGIFNLVFAYRAERLYRSPVCGTVD